MRRSPLTPLEKQPLEVFYKNAALKNFAISHRKTPVLESPFNKVADLQACNIIKKRLQYRCFPVNIGKSLRAAILRIICERLLLLIELFCTDFVDISYENASFSILEDSIWLKLIYFLTTIAFWLMKYLFLIDGDMLVVVAKNLTLCRIYRSNQSSWKIHSTA